MRKNSLQVTRAKFKSVIDQIPKHVWIFLGIMVVAFFLRTYNFQPWLHFGNDQSRDAAIAKDVLSGKTQWPLLGSSMGNTRFRLGPIYNYFQIISGKVFGTSPEKFAYPDLIASLASIPILYLLLKRYFKRNLALALTGLYAISYYSIEYARFGWNSNPMPFFVILFILALGEFLVAGVQAAWIWVVLTGVAIGVGVQLHAILLLIMGATTMVALLFSIKQNWRILGKWAVVFLIILVLNLPMIINERETDYLNSKLFLASFSDKSDSGSGRFVRNLELNIACHAQANSLILTSIGNKENCDFLYSRPSGVKKGSKLRLPWKKPISMIGITASIFLVLAGFSLLLRKTYVEKNKKNKYFYGLVLVYASFSFLVMLPIIDLAPVRYFIQVIFVPFILLGLVLEFLQQKYLKHFKYIVVAIFVVFASANAYSLIRESELLKAKSRGNSGYLVLGEVQPLVDFMVRQVGSEKKAYLLGGTRYLSPYSRTLTYLADEQGLELITESRQNLKTLPQAATVFYIGESLRDLSLTSVRELPFSDRLNVGDIAIYKVKH